ncbi:MAG: class I SAM-dependent methyltransferase [Gammaproteobacteria bacterium]|nr:class I SAM-dependent methyltransferase [Gammaproteobacteria bacterium]
MSTKPDSADANETLLDQRWRQHSDAWIDAVRARRIPSRVAVTDQALVDAILDYRPDTLLDLGCGEGWLARRLAPLGIAVTGIDAAPALIDAARQAGGGRFVVAGYDALPPALGSFAMAVSSFALLGKEPVERLFAALPQRLPGGHFIVQTLHPLIACGEQPYRDGWRRDSWTAFSAGVEEPPPWYFRTLESWVRLFGAHGLRLLELREPRAPATGQPASVVFIAAVP